jgi:hypothetical protein
MRRSMQGCFLIAEVEPDWRAPVTYPVTINQARLVFLQVGIVVCLGMAGLIG